MSNSTSVKDLKSIVQSLHALERKVLPFLKQDSSLEQLASASGLDKTSVLRALQWLRDKNLVELIFKEVKTAKPSDLGITYKDKGLPEQVVLKTLLENTSQTNTKLEFEKALQLSNLSQQEFQAAIGVLKKKGLIFVSKTSEGLFLGLIDRDKALQSVESLAEFKVLQKLPVNLEFLSSEELEALKNLVNRKKIVVVETSKQVIVKPSQVCKTLAEQFSTGSVEEFVDITPEVLKTKQWKHKKLRVLNVTSPVPKLLFGKKHLIRQAEEFIRQIWLSMGFKEMKGSLIQPSFWNFDALFVPQDHPAREMQDTYYLPFTLKVKHPVVRAVKKAHEQGVAGSTGWRYRWSEKLASKPVLRTHTTVLSALTLKDLKLEELPAKFFAIGHVFRNETLDWKHLFDFIQVEGIVVDENANMKQLKSYLTIFYKMLGYEDVKIKPSYFPYTEPSAEVLVLHKDEWLELGGCGILRPEVVQPLLGKPIPVLAWGLGLERAVLLKYNFKDVRQIYSQDIDFLRSLKAWV